MAKAKPQSSSEPALPRIHAIRKPRVVLDADLAALFGAGTERLNEAVRRNLDRFPADFSFELAEEELAPLGSQFPTPKGRGGRRSLPRAFTEHGALMAANILGGPKATRMSICLVRASVQMRDELTANPGVLRRLAAIDKKLLEHDVVLREVLERLQPLINPAPEKPKPKIGFHRGNR